MLTFLTSKVLLWICGGLLVALVVSSSLASCAHQNANTARAQRDQWESTANVALDANKTNVDTIDKLLKANKGWRDLFPSLQQLQTIQADLQREIEDTNKRDADYARAKEKDRASDPCAALLRSDVEQLCPTVARSLRRSAGGD